MTSKEIIATSLFGKSLKRLAKRFPGVRRVYSQLLEELQTQKKLGEEIAGRQNFFKVRYANRDANRGKSGGFRVIYWKKPEAVVILLIDIYSKTDQEDSDWKQVDLLAEEIKELEKKKEPEEKKNDSPST